MHSILQRLNSLSATATSAILSLLALISLSTFIIPHTLQPTSLKMSNLNVVMGRSAHERFAKEREFAFAKFDLVADLSPLFNWNTKQVFVQLLADYSTPEHPQNSVVIWDRIVRSKKYAKINLAQGKQKYEFKEIGNTFRNVSASFALKYFIMPHVGALTSGEAVRTEVMTFPGVQRRGVS